MYRHDELDQALVRIDAFRDQVERRLAGEITEEEFRPLRLSNGVELWDHAYILRIPIPRGVLSSSQLRMLAHVACLYDRGYAHLSAHQGIEFHWPALSDIPTVLAELASVGLSSIETGSGFIRNKGVDQFADAAPRDPDHVSVTIPLEGARDLSDRQLEVLADLAETYGSGELHISDGQEIVLPHVGHANLASVHDGLVEIGLETCRGSDATLFRKAEHARDTQAA